VALAKTESGPTSVERSRSLVFPPCEVQ